MDGGSKKTKFRTEKEPPEGGWGYFIALGLAIPNAAFYGHLSSFGLLYNDFLESIGAGSSAVTLLVGVTAGSMSFAGLFIGILLRNFSIRTVGLIGAISYTLGSFLTIFAKTVPHLIVAFSIFQGLGIGLMFTVGYTNFNQYFIRRRVFMMSVTQVIKGVFTTAYPFMINFLLYNFGYRGALAMIAAINSHTIFAMLCQHPVEWHFKRIEVPIEEPEPCNFFDHSFKCKPIMPQHVQKLSIERVKSMSIESPEERMNRFNLRKIERSRSLYPYAEIPDQYDSVARRLTTIMCVNDLGRPSIIQDIKESTATRKWQKIIEFLDLTLLKDVVYINIVLGVTFAVFTDSSFYTLFPMYLFKLGFSKTNVVTVISAGAACDFLSRVFLALVSYFIQFKARYIFLIGVLATLLFRYILLSTHSFVGILIVMATLGFFRTFYHAPISLVFAEHLPHEKFASGYGLFLFIEGNLIFLLGPIVGFIRDYTKSYIIYFQSLSILLSLCAIPWTIEIIYHLIQKKRRHKSISKNYSNCSNGYSQEMTTF